MHRLIPGFIQEQYIKDTLTGSFEACTLFVDVSGFTAITDGLMGYGQHGAEILANIIQEVFDPLMERVFEQGGFVTNLAGDAFTAVFPRDDRLTGAAERGLAAAWKMQQIMTSSAEHQTPYGAFSMSVKVGLAAGKVTWGIVSSTDGNRATYYFQGGAIDRCAAAQKAAQPGELLVDAAVYGALGSKVSSKPVGDYFRIPGIHSSLPSSLPMIWASSSRRFCLFFPAGSDPGGSERGVPAGGQYVRQPAHGANGRAVGAVRKEHL